MVNRIIELLKEKNLSFDCIKEALNIESSKDFIELNKTLNKMMEEEIIFEIKGIYYLMANYHVASVKRDRGFTYVNEGRILEVENASAFSLYSNDQIIYEDKKYYAKCLKVVKRAVTYVLGVVVLKNRSLYFFSDDIRFATYNVVNFKDYKKQLKKGQRLLTYISDYAKQELKIIKIIGDINDKNVLVDTILLMNDAPNDFSDKVYNELKTIDENVVLDKRKDLRTKSFVTIDGDDAKDFDDAIYVERNDDGYRLYVSIADVSHYVKEGTALDKEALNRGTSIYYPGHVIPMLPFKLCDDLCSLKEGVDRYTLTCEMQVDFEGNVNDYSIYPSVINSKHRLTYSLVNRLLEHDKEAVEKYKDICPMIYTAYELSRIADKQRKSKGGIEFESNEPIIIEEDGKVVDIRLRQQGKAELLIEDFMIMANETVATYMNNLGYPLIYRNHDYPKADKITDFIRHMENLGYFFKGNKLEIKSSTLQKCLSSFEGKDEYSIVSDMLLRSMAKALYESTCNGHYGLGLDNYCHFTSPIRRYPDLMVHRMLKKYIFNGHLEDIDEDNVNNDRIAKLCNGSEKRAVQIERNILDLKRCEYMADKIGLQFEGVISSVVKWGFYVELNNTVEGLVSIYKLPGLYEYEDGVISDGYYEYRVGQKVLIEVDYVDLYRRNIDFRIIKGKKKMV